MEDDVKYIVVEDLQGGSFGTERIYTLDEWREQAYSWADSDDWFDNDDEANDYQQMLTNLDEEELIDYISDHWEIVMAKVFEYNGDLYAYCGRDSSFEFYSVEDECGVYIEDEQLAEELAKYVKSLDSNKDN